MTRYCNAFHVVGKPQYGPESYETDAQPTATCGGLLIYERVKGRVWDVVADSVCVHQRADLHGALAAAERWWEERATND